MAVAGVERAEKGTPRMTTTLIKDEKCAQPSHKDRRNTLCGQDGSGEIFVCVLRELCLRCLRIERQTHDDDDWILKRRAANVFAGLVVWGQCDHHVF